MYQLHKLSAKVRTPHSGSRTRTAHLAWGSKNYLPVRAPSLLKRKKMHPSTAPNQNFIKRIQPAQRRGKKSFSQTTCALWELSASWIHGKGENLSIYLCQPKLWHLWPSHHIPTFSLGKRSHSHNHMGCHLRAEPAESSPARKSKFTLCADWLLSHTGRGTRGWSHGSPKPRWLKLWWTANQHHQRRGTQQPRAKQAQLQSAARAGEHSL